MITHTLVIKLHLPNNFCSPSWSLWLTVLLLYRHQRCFDEARWSTQLHQILWWADSAPSFQQCLSYLLDGRKRLQGIWSGSSHHMSLCSPCRALSRNWSMGNFLRRQVSWNFPYIQPQAPFLAVIRQSLTCAVSCMTISAQSRQVWNFILSDCTMYCDHEIRAVSIVFGRDYLNQVCGSTLTAEGFVSDALMMPGLLSWEWFKLR